MPIHNLICSTVVSGLQDVDLIIKSLEWMCKKEDIVKIEKTKSFHGSPITIINVKLSRSLSRMTLSRLGREVLTKLLDEANERLDNENRLHFRLNQNDLVSGKISIANNNESSIKMIAKIEVYPGEKPLEIVQKLISESIERGQRRGWFDKPPDFYNL